MVKLHVWHSRVIEGAEHVEPLEASIAMNITQDDNRLEISSNGFYFRVQKGFNSASMTFFSFWPIIYILIVFN